MPKFFLAVFLMGVTLFSSAVYGQEATSPLQEMESTKQTLSSASDPLNPVKVQLISENQSIQAGQPFWVIIRLEAEKGWHSYWKNPGEVGMPTQVKWELPPGFEASDLVWPYPQKFEEEGFVSYGYLGTVDLLALITPSSSIKETDQITLKAQVDWMFCKESCVPGSSSIELALSVKDSNPALSSHHQSLFETARKQIPLEKQDIWAEKNNFGITLFMPSVESLSYEEAHFFPTLPLPEEAKLLEEFVHQNGQYELRLSFDKEEAMPIASLDGVIVLKTKGEEIAWHVHPQIQGATVTEASAMGFGLALLLALIGGLILNLMPCVLPVIALKVMSFVKLSAECRKTTLKHGLAFFGGALIAFWILAAILLAFRAYGQSVGWGFQLQSPLFVASLGLVLWIFGLSLFGVFEMGTSISSAAGQAQSRNKGLMGSFSSGILATAVATPCTGPFLGATVGFAITLPSASAMLIFTAMGIGMGFPYLLLAFFPRLLRFIPKPGPWMVVFKESMGFLMMATVLWLAWVFAAQTTSTALLVLMGALFSVSLGCWIYGKWGSPAKTQLIRWMGRSVAALLLVGSAWAVFTVSSLEEIESALTATYASENKEAWIPFSPEKLAELRAKNIPVFIDFTAKWCLICQANKVVMHSNDVMKKFAEKGVVTMRADWTKNDATITKELQKYGRNGVPLYLFYLDGKEPEILPQLLTKDVIVKLADQIPMTTTENIAQIQ